MRLIALALAPAIATALALLSEPSSALDAAQKARLPYTAYRGVELYGMQQIDSQTAGNPSSKSSLFLDAAKTWTDKFEIAAALNCSTNQGSQWLSNPTQGYLGQMVCLASNIQVDQGSGGGYAVASVVNTGKLTTKIPLVNAEWDMNYNGPDCGADDHAFAGGALEVPCYMNYFAGIGTGKLSAIVGYDLFGYRLGSPTPQGLGAQRGLVFFNGDFARGTIEDYTNSMYALRVGGTKSDSVINFADAVVTSNIGVLFGNTHAIGWRSNNGVTPLPLISKDLTDTLVLGGGLVGTRISPAANQNLKVRAGNEVAGAVTLQAVNDANNANTPMVFIASGFNFLGGPVNAGSGINVNLDATTYRGVVYGQPNSGGQGYRALVVPN